MLADLESQYMRKHLRQAGQMSVFAGHYSYSI